MFHWETTNTIDNWPKIQSPYCLASHSKGQICITIPNNCFHGDYLRRSNHNPFMIFGHESKQKCFLIQRLEVVWGCHFWLRVILQLRIWNLRFCNLPFCHHARHFAAWYLQHFGARSFHSSYFLQHFRELKPSMSHAIYKILGSEPIHVACYLHHFEVGTLMLHITCSMLVLELPFLAEDLQHVGSGFFKFARYLQAVVGCWLLFVVCWLLVVGCGLLVVGCELRVVGVVCCCCPCGHRSRDCNCNCNCCFCCGCNSWVGVPDFRFLRRCFGSFPRIGFFVSPWRLSVPNRFCNQFVNKQLYNNRAVLCQKGLTTQSLDMVFISTYVNKRRAALSVLDHKRPSK